MTWLAICSRPGMKTPPALRSTPKNQTTMTIKPALLSLALAALFGLATNSPVHAQANGSKSPLDALTPGFWKLFDRKAQLTKVGSGFGFTEGPVWDPDR